jgi:hypothetical protein
MKIAIYGDSFGQDYDGWPYYLELLFKQSKVKTYAVPGTSCEFSYSKFLETHKNYDIVIFLWTSTDRSSLITKKNNNTYKCHSSFNYYYDVNYSYALGKYLNKKYSNTFDSLNSDIKEWINYEHFLLKKYPTRNFLFNKSMRDSVKLNRPDCINIECFTEFCNYGLINVFFEDLNQLKIKFVEDLNLRLIGKELKFKENGSIRRNHLTRIQNMEFAEYLHCHIKEKEFDVHKTFSNPKKYYTMSKTIEESGIIL